MQTRRERREERPVDYCGAKADRAEELRITVALR
jgi:hypothetical protein